MEQYKLDHEKVLMCLWMLKDKSEAIEHCLEIAEKEVANQEEGNDCNCIFENYLRNLKMYKEIEDNKKKSA